MFFRNLRYRIAFKFGWMEHITSRILFGMLIVTLLVHLVKQYQIVQYLLYADIILWILYWFFHRMEKLAHPNH